MKKILYVILLFSSHLFSQELINDTLNEVSVISSRANFQIGTEINVIYLEEINNAPVQTIEDLLEYAVNVDIRQRGMQGVQSDISIRGGTFEQVLVMLNGIKLNDPQTGHHTMDLPVSIEQVERIEVITGGATRVFGNYAYTGAINIVTKSDLDNSVLISAGENNFMSGEINYHTTHNKIKHNISISNKKSDGYVPGMDYKIENYYYQLKAKISNVNSLLNFGYTNKEFGAYSFYTPVYPDQFEKTKTLFTSLQFRKEGDITLDQKMYWRHHTDEFVLFRDNPSLYHNFHETNVFGSDFNVIQKTKTGTNVIGMEIRTDNILSNRLGLDLDDKIMIDSVNYYDKGASTTITNLFAEKNIRLNKLMISSGFMMNIDSKYGSEYFPGLDISYNLTEKVRFFTSFNRSMRTPNYTELYYSSPTNQGNSNLRSEFSTNQEFGLRWNGDLHNSVFTYYNRKGNDMIDWVLVSGDSIWRAQNFGQITVTGYEINTKIDINKILSLKLPISHLSINYSVNELDTSSEGFQSAYLLDYLSSKAAFSLSQNISQKIRIDWRACYQDREGGFQEFDSGDEIEYLPFWLFSSRISYNLFNKNTLFLEVNNIFNVEYFDFGNVPQPGRWMRCGIKIRF